MIYKEDSQDGSSDDDNMDEYKDHSTDDEDYNPMKSDDNMDDYKDHSTDEDYSPVKPIQRLAKVRQNILIHIKVIIECDIAL